MERTITWIAGGVALAILVLLPLSYFGVHYYALQSELRLAAENNARQVTQLINAAPDLWQFQTDRIEEVLSRRSGDSAPESRRLRDAQARTLADSLQPLDEPTVSLTLPVFDAGREVGRIEVERSLRPALLGAGLATLFASLLAGAVFVALRLLPLRALRRAERKAAEQTAHAAFLEKAHREAAEEARVKGQFLARLTHEIRAPLGGLLGMTDSLRSGSMPEAQRLQAQRAHASGTALLQVVNDILDYSQLQSQDASVLRQAFDPVLLVESVIEQMTPQAEAAGLTLFYQVGPGLPTEMEGDPGRLRRVLNNLVGNAIKFTQRGEVKLTVSWVAATVSSPAGIHFEVRDTGIGISPDDQARLFRPMGHADLGSSQQVSTGLGLAISRQLVHLMGGQMGLQSQLGRGSKFWFELPQEQLHIVHAQALPTNAAGQTLHVLVADSHNGRARAMCCRLLALGVRVNAVHNAGALRTVLAKPRHPFTHVLVLSSLRVSSDEAPHLRWITLDDNAQRGLEWDDTPADALSLPCRRDDLVRALLGDAPVAKLTEVIEVTEVAEVIETARADEQDDPDDPEEDTVRDDLPQASAVAADDFVYSELAPEPVTNPVQSTIGRAMAAHATPERAHAPEPEPQPAAEPATPTVLLVEGNEVSQEVGRALLEAMGCEVYVADGGHEALQRLPQGFSLILLDLQMPGMDGYTTAREIRRWEAQLPAPRRTPLVALTADSIIDVQERCNAAGLDDIVTKPVNLDALRETLERHLPELAPA